MSTTSDPYTKPPSAESSFDAFVRAYSARGGGKSGEAYRGLGKSGANALGSAGIPAQMVGLNNLYQMLLGQGRVDPRLLAKAQAANARATQAQANTARAGAAQGGMGRGGLQAALQGAIGSAGANRAANLNYQDIADSYGRNQQNLGLLNELVIQPTLGYANLGVADADQQNRLKAAKLGAYGSLLGSAGSVLGYGG